MIVTEAYKQADQDYLEACTCKELSEKLTIAGIKGRSKATTKAQKVELLMTAYFGYGYDAAGNITQNITPIAQNTENSAEISQKPAKTAKPEPTRRELAEEAQIYGWDVVNLNGIYAIQHDRARPGEYMATAKTLKRIATRLKGLIAEWQYATVDCTQHKFYDRYFWKKSKGNFATAA